MHDKPEGADGGDQGSGEAAPRAAPEKALITVPLDGTHRTPDFRCSKNERIQGFFVKELPEFGSHNYTRVFIYADPADPGKILGYYTLSASFIYRRWLKNKFQKVVPGGIPVPMALLGFLGRHDESTKGLGATLVHDAALRVSRITDIGIWGMMLDADGDGLVKYYEALGFMLAVNPKNPGDAPPRLMYAPLSVLLPVL